MKILCFDIGTKTLSYCLLEIVPVEGAEPVLSIHEWETIDVHAEAGLSDKAKPTMREDCEYVINSISTRIRIFLRHNVDNMIIEQQPAGGKNMFSSVRMKVVSHAVHAYLYAQQIGSETAYGQIYEGNIPVTFVSPASKLTGLRFIESASDTAARQAGDRKTMGAKYRANKRHAVEMTAALLETMEGDLAHRARVTFAAATPKQDDVADAFMLAYAFGKKALAPKPTRKRKASA